MSNIGSTVSSNQSGNLRLYLQTCKLLDLALTLPANMLPQFQMYRWAFISQPSDTENETFEDMSNLDRLESDSSDNDSSSIFEPVVVRIEKCMHAKVNQFESLFLKVFFNKLKQIIYKLFIFTEPRAWAFELLIKEAINHDHFNW